MSHSKNFVFFWGHTAKSGPKACLSNFYPASFTDPSDGHRYANSEQYFMYRKAMLFGDLEIAQACRTQTDPMKVKGLGRQVQGFDAKVWDAHCRDAMLDACILKFSQNEDIAEILLSTGEKRLVEASPHDAIWGIGLSAADAQRTPVAEWPGTNYLGVVLEKVREHLRRPSPSAAETATSSSSNGGTSQSTNNHKSTSGTTNDCTTSGHPNRKRSLNADGDRHSPAPGDSGAPQWAGDVHGQGHVEGNGARNGRRIKVVFDMETQDPDDFLCLIFLASHPAVQLEAVTLVPGSPQQVGLVRWLLGRLRHPPVRLGADLCDKKGTVSPWHQRAFFAEWGHGPVPESREVDGPAWRVLRDCGGPDVVLVTGGPLTNVAAAIKHAGAGFGAATWMCQGGFAGVNVAPPDAVLPKFAGKREMRTFNFGSNLPAAHAALAHTGFREKLLVSKNVCHSPDNVFTADQLQRLERACAAGVRNFERVRGGEADWPQLASGRGGPGPRDKAHAEVEERHWMGLMLLVQGMREYLRRKDGKALHDPLAAATVLNRRCISEWREVQMYEDKDHRWGCTLAGGSGTFISVRHDAACFWRTFLREEECGDAAPPASAGDCDASAAAGAAVDAEGPSSGGSDAAAAAAAATAELPPRPGKCRKGKARLQGKR